MNDDDGKINRMIDPLVTSGLDAVVFSEKGLILKDILSISSYVNSYSVCNKGRYIIILSQDGDLDTLNLFDVTKNKVINEEIKCRNKMQKQDEGANDSERHQK